MREVIRGSQEIKKRVMYPGLGRLDYEALLYARFDKMRS